MEGDDQNETEQLRNDAEILLNRAVELHNSGKVEDALHAGMLACWHAGMLALWVFSEARILEAAQED
jgi:hypothetical protein